MEVLPKRGDRRDLGTWEEVWDDLDVHVTRETR